MSQDSNHLGQMPQKMFPPFPPGCALDIQKAKRKFKKTIEELEITIELLNRCVKERLNPQDKDWPKAYDFRKLIEAVKGLDPVGNRRNHHPFWKKILASVDGRKGPKPTRYKIRKAIDRFIQYAEPITQQYEIPKITQAEIQEIRRSDGQNKTPYHGTQAIEMIKKTVLGSGDVKLLEFKKLLPLTSKRFQKEWAEAEKSMPLNAAEKDSMQTFLGLVAALDLYVTNSIFIRSWKWIDELGEFITLLENDAFAEFAKQLTQITIEAQAYSEQQAIVKRRQGKERQRSKRKITRDRDKKGGIARERDKNGKIGSNP